MTSPSKIKPTPVSREKENYGEILKKIIEWNYKRHMINQFVEDPQERVKAELKPLIVHWDK